MNAPLRAGSPNPLLFARVAGIAAFGGLAVLLSTLLIPALRTLNHEFSQFYAVASTIGFFLLSAWYCERVQGSPLQRLNRGVVHLMGLYIGTSALVYLGMALINMLGPDCRFEAGRSFFWLTSLPVGLLAVVAGSAMGVRGSSYKALLGLILAAGALTIAHDLAQAIWGPHIVDFFFGEPLGFDQRMGMRLTETHVQQRLLVLAIAIELWMLVLWRFGSSLCKVGGILGGATLLLSLSLAAPEMGIGWSWSAVHRHLDSEHRTEHFVIHHASTGAAMPHVDGLARDAEWAWHDLSTLWKIEPEAPYHIYFFENPESQQIYTGIAAPHAGIRCVSISTPYIFDDTLRHELVHAMHIELDPSVFVVLNRGVLEGFAQAYTEPYTLVPEAHQRLAAVLESDLLPQARQVFSITGFYTLNESNAYDSAASFVGFLIFTRGFDKFRDYMKDLDFKETYGQEIDSLDSEWRAFLRALPVETELLADAKDSFDPDRSPSYSNRRCPKLGPRRLDLQQEADLRRNNGQWSVARDLYETLYQRDGKARWAALAANCARQDGDCERAITLTDRVLLQPELERTERTRLLDARLPCQLALHDWDSVWETLDTLDSLERRPSSDRAFLREALSRPGIRDRLADALSTEDILLRRAEFEDLARQYPDDQALHYLLLTRAQLIMEPRRNAELRVDQRQALDRLLKDLLVFPEASNRVSQRLLSFANRAIRARDYALAQRIADTLSYTLTARDQQILASEMNRRITWERGF